jgi:2-polyprenyl-3-methyl-5-hydroxy-6-metoxy-1,4-benzoquinol methylase
MSSEIDKTEDVPTPDGVLDLLWPGYQLALVKAGFELQVWAKVAAGRRTACEMAEAEGWDPIGTRMLLDAFVGMGLLGKDNAGYCLNPMAETYLLPTKRTYIGDAFLFDLGWEQRGQLAQAIRTGQRPVIGGYTTAEKAAFWVGHFAGRRVAPDRGLEDFDKLWQALGVEAREGLRILDVACGTGIKTLALARQHPGVRVTLQDWPEVLEAATSIAAKLGLADQVSTLPGDLQAVDYGEEQFDVVWFGNVTHYYGPKDLVDLLRKAWQALVPGGMVVVNAPLADEARCERDYPLLGAIEMFVWSAEGDVYSGTEYRSFLEQAGLVDVREVSESLIKATRLSGG